MCPINEDIYVYGTPRHPERDPPEGVPTLGRVDATHAHAHAHATDGRTIDAHTDDGDDGRTDGRTDGRVGILGGERRIGVRIVNHGGEIIFIASNRIESNR